MAPPPPPPPSQLPQLPQLPQQYCCPPPGSCPAAALPQPSPSPCAVRKTPIRRVRCFTFARRPIDPSTPSSGMRSSYVRSIRRDGEQFLDELPGPYLRQRPEPRRAALPARPLRSPHTAPKGRRVVAPPRHRRAGTRTAIRYVWRADPSVRFPDPLGLTRDHLSVPPRPRPDPRPCRRADRFLPAAARPPGRGRRGLRGARGVPLPGPLCAEDRADREHALAALARANKILAKHHPKLPVTP